MLLRTLFQHGLVIAGLLMPTAAACQSIDGLILRGEPSRSSDPCEGRKEGQDCIKFRMVFENNGKEALILINPSLGFGTGIKEAHIFYPEYGKGRAIIDLEGARKSVITVPAERERFRMILSSFDVNRPPQNLTIVLQPGESYTFDEKFLVTSDTRIPEDQFAEIRWKHPIGESCDQRGCLRIPSGMKLVYEFSFLPYIEDPAFLDKLAHRWRGVGRFPVGPNGTYTVTSEVIRRGF